ncbi:NDP-hexose 2,3-dehydratase family protein [Phytoactinopolyspora limicola]|uniref:NDP-hexose 2,3-dehydratase family protein n=1 Tax=Phytoactinopolyspora limicola TaxID=2715536 RepID=UPI0014093205|nr:NDP-hexose 2,3-dehydratase family protein [Phytoactinopolyspora limicola]
MTTTPGTIEPTAAPGPFEADLAGFDRVLRQAGDRSYCRTERVPLADLDGWYSDPLTGWWHHCSGRFFSVEGLHVRLDAAPASTWCQPIVNQPEVGILGILIKQIDGATYCLMQFKAEPGNIGGIQLSPTVQATRSNYTGVHGGSAVPYLDYFRDAAPSRVLADVRQSEQGAWFLRKRNRNIIVSTDDDVPVHDGFCWLSVDQLLRLMRRPDLVNMDTRTVLSLLPWVAATTAAAVTQDRRPAGQDEVWSRVLRRECALAVSRHEDREIQNWITDVRTRIDLAATPAPMRALTGWQRDDAGIRHETGAFFEVIGVGVESAGREVAQWSQPMLATREDGVVAFLITRIDGVLHALLHLRSEPGLTDVAELAPTVQCIPGNYTFLPEAARPPFLDTILNAAPTSIRFDTTLSDEGGRFYRISNRHLIVETDTIHTHPDYRWMSVRQLAELLRHSHYLNVQARGLLVCLFSVLAGTVPDGTASGG